MVAESILTLQKQPDSLASVVLQNWQGLDLLTAEKGVSANFYKENAASMLTNQR
jgi:hypothetical protein